MGGGGAEISHVQLKRVALVFMSNNCQTKIRLAQKKVETNKKLVTRQPTAANVSLVPC